MYKKIVFLLIISLGVLTSPLITASATSACPPDLSLQDCQEWALNQVGGASGLGTAGEVQSTTISQKIGQIISYVLAFLGVAFLVIVITSGIQWMTAGGNEEKITKAKGRLINATIGLAIIIAAYAITWFVVTKLQTTIPPAASSTPTSTPQ